MLFCLLLLFFFLLVPRCDGLMMVWGGILGCAGYYLFFSSNVYSTLNYDISYAVSQSVTGPFKKVQAPNAPFLTS